MNVVRGAYPQQGRVTLLLAAVHGLCDIKCYQEAQYKISRCVYNLRMKCNGPSV
jgi:hypothetical protein